MNELLHRTSELTQPLWKRLVAQIRRRPLVGADETRLLMQDDGTGKSKNGFVWTFVAPDEHGDRDVAYIYAGDRSGETPKRLLGGTKGTLMVDAYSGYNIVAVVSYPDLSDAGLKDHVLWGTLMLVLAVYGPGKLAVDRLVSRAV